MEEEQVYTIPLRDARKTQKQKRAAKAVKLVKQFIKKHANVSEVKISSDLNQKIWSQSAGDPPARVRVRAVKRSERVAEVSPLE